MPIRFLATNLWDTATVTANSAATGFPVTNIATRLFLEHWRSTGLTAEWVKADLGADTVVRAVAIRYSNLRVGDSLSIQAQTAANGDDWDGSPALTLNVAITITADMVTKGLIVYNWEAAPTACRYFRALMTATAHPDTYIRIGRIYLGTFVELDRDFDKDWTVQNVTPSTVLTSATGQKYTNTLPQFKRINVNLPWLSSADATKIEALRDALGSDKAFFVELFPATSLQMHSYYVTCTSDWSVRHVFGGQMYTTSLTFEDER